MKTLVLAPLVALAATLALPAAAAAACPGAPAGSFTDSCEQGVRVIRNQPLALPRISPARAAQLQLQRERLAADRQRAAAQYDIQRRQLALKQNEQNLTSYLYKDANSPLRGFNRGFGGYGFGGYGVVAGPVVRPRRPVRRRH